MKKYDVVIIGSGPAGLGSAFKLIESNPKLKILLLEKEKICSGGLLNDCKQNYTFPIGFTESYWQKEEAEKYLEEVKTHLKPNILKKENITKYQLRAEKVGVKLLDIKQAHIGTDKSVFLIRDLLAKLGNLGVEVKLKSEVLEIEKDAVITDSETYSYKKLIIAPGRMGFSFLQRIMNNFEINYVDNIVDIGIRVETKLENYDIVKDYYDPKFYFPNKVRTFCTNSGNAYVTMEKYHKFNIVNGHALSKDKGENNLVNFAMLRTIGLKKPVRSGQVFATYLARVSNEIGGGLPIMQRIGDFVAGKRSKIEHFNDDLFDFKPTCKACAGDITLAAPSKVMRDLWNSLKLLNDISPGLLHPSTILYYPEIKMYANRPEFVDEYFRVNENMYMIGDGAGTSRGITGAWASGIRAAIGILGSE